MAQYAIHAVGLRKQFGDTVAVDGVDLAVPEGGIYGFLGPNGAGKTTTIRMLATLVRPTAGQATVFGYDLVANTDEVRARISLTGQYASVDEDLTGMENLVMMGRLLGHGRRSAADRARELLSAFGLEAAADRQAKRYSGGMRRRLDIAASIVITPALLFLDEPTTGLDPRSRSRVWDVVRALTDNGTTVLLTTQYLEEADRLADRLAVIDHGRIIAEGTTAQLKESVGAGAVRVRLRDPDRRSDAERLLERVRGGAGGRPPGNPARWRPPPAHPGGPFSAADRTGYGARSDEAQDREHRPLSAPTEPTAAAGNSPAPGDP
ncbi:ATP-binding cassette domain-containing protein, partial [Nocardia otitidiscaviarum]|uniref:ATP-binding cassette domain-containing protein n=1 Tax=Nocardia otitidiscaviarum TaxID=1823 RepID=UPI00245517B8